MPDRDHHENGEVIDSPRRRPPRWARACLTGGLVMITAVLIIRWQLAPAAADFGADQTSAGQTIGQPADVQPTGGIGPAANQSAPTATPAPDSQPGPESIAAQPDPNSIPPEDPGVNDPSDQRPVAGIPTALDLPTLGVHADVHPVGITAGQLEVPTDPSDVGWWTGSVAAGSAAGATIIDGHVDSAEYGTGALYRLTDLAIGDTVQVTVAGGGVVTYRVNERRSYDKETGLPAGIFSTDGTPRLVLITCGGTFDKNTGSYESNVAVFASPT